MKSFNYIVLSFSILFAACHAPKIQPASAVHAEGVKHINVDKYDTNTYSIHVYVALCDNKYQGIAKVPEGIGNGQDPGNNLYWGCAYGVKGFFKKSEEWKLLETRYPDTMRLQRLVFQSTVKNNYYLIADAYDGRCIKECTENFFRGCAGQIKDTIIVHEKVLGIDGNAKLLAYVGHNGLPEFSIPSEFKNTDNKKRDCIILACKSKEYFLPILKSTKANPLLWTTFRMSPEAYTLHDAIRAYIKGQPSDSIAGKAAYAYAKYQKCSFKAARGLLVCGW